VRQAARRDRIEGKVRLALEQCGVSVFPLNEPALPDLLCFFRKRAFLVEVKSDGKSRLTPTQRPFHEEAQQMGWPVYIVRRVDAVLDVINNLEHRK
jgi:hypothetical protein